MNVVGTSATQNQLSAGTVSQRIEQSRVGQRTLEGTQKDLGTKKFANETEQTQSEQQRDVSEEEVIKAIEKANESFKGNNARFEYSIHEDTKRIMVKVVNPATDEVIREIPAEKILDLVARIWEFSGILVDEKR